MFKSWEPVECPFCCLTPATAFANGASMPMAEVRGLRYNGETDVWIRCECVGANPVSLHEESLRRQERAHGRACPYDGLRWVIWAESWGRKDRNAGSQSEATGKAKAAAPAGLRPEQEQLGFPDPCEGATFADTFCKSLCVSLPAWMVKQIADRAGLRGQTESAHLREVLGSPVPGEVPKLTGPRSRVSFRTSSEHWNLVNVVRVASGTSRSDVVAAWLGRFWLSQADVDAKLRRVRDLSR